MSGTGIPGHNVSHKYKSLWIAPSRTGSRLLAQIFSFYDFKFNSKPIFLCGEYSYSHITLNTDEFPNYRVICNARNPYGRVHSHFVNYATIFPEKNKNNFKEYLERKLWKNNNLQHPILIKKPDNVIRLEFISEDIIKIPFIYDLLTEKQLNLMIKHPKPLEDWEPFYDHEMKEMVYSDFENHFNFWGYEK